MPKRDADEAADGEAAAASKPAKKPAPGPTTSAKAAAKGEEMLPRSETPRKPALASSEGICLVHWNVAGLNSLLNTDEKKARLKALVEAESPDVLAISEHKIAPAKLDAFKTALGEAITGYSQEWAVCTVKNGYSGVVCLVRDGVSVKSVEIDTVGSLSEGRTITLELADCFAVAAYVPNSGQDLKRLDYRVGTWEPAMRAHLKGLEERPGGKPVVLFGDLNVAHLDADIWNVTAKHIAKSAGLTPQERAAFGTLLESGPYVDCFRSLWPDASHCYSYWSTRSGNQLLNRGLRLDYAVASKAIVDDPAAPLALHDCAILYEYAPNGDHAPTLVSFQRKTPT